MHYTSETAPEIIEFNGTKYRRMGGSRNYYLSQSTTNFGRKNAKGLHVAIWEYHSGNKVLKGYEINHKDGNTFNFDKDNLECLPMLEHQRIPKNYNYKKQCAHLEEIRPLASNWHKSEAGREWHKKNVYGSLKKEIHYSSCYNCGNSFSTYFAGKIYCGRKCGIQCDWGRKAPRVQNK